MNAKAKEGALAYNKVDRAPCCYELVLSVPRKQTKFELLRGIAHCIAQRIPSELQNVHPFGCCDVGQFLVKFEGEAIYNAKVKVLHNIYPSHYPKLGDYFDDLHPVVFGDPELCSQIARAVGPGVELVSGDKAHRIACLVRTPDCKIDVARAKASRWLLMKNGEPLGPPE